MKTTTTRQTPSEFYMWKTQMGKTTKSVNSKENITNYMVFKKGVAHCQIIKAAHCQNAYCIDTKE